MHKLIVERPRRGHSDGNPSVIVERHRHLSDALPKHAPMRPRRRTRKELNENLAPLRRFLMRQVGRPWDRVYSEIRAHLSPRSAVQMHIQQHIFDYVSLHVRIEGHLVVPLRSWPGYWRALYDDGRTLYVHPVTGLLCRPKQSRPKRARAQEPQ